MPAVLRRAGAEQHRPVRRQGRRARRRPGCLTVALFFLRFWISSGDRFFGLFALAFLVFGVNRFVRLFLDEADEARTLVYVVRLVAFVLIIAAIVDKNGNGRPSPSAAVCPASRCAGRRAR